MWHLPRVDLYGSQQKAGVRSVNLWHYPCPWNNEAFQESSSTTGGPRSFNCQMGAIITPWGSPGCGRLGWGSCKPVVLNFLMLHPFSTVSHIVVTPNHKVISSLPHNCNLTTIINCNVNIRYATLEGCDPQAENCSCWEALESLSRIFHYRDGAWTSTLTDTESWRRSSWLSGSWGGGRGPYRCSLPYKW